MAWLKLVPGLAWGAAALLAVVLVQELRVQVAQQQAESAGAELADYRLQVAERDRRAEAAAREEERRRQTEVDRITGEANDQAEQARADAADADQRADSLQQQVARLLASRGATCSAIAAQGGPPARDAAVLLAYVLGRVEQAGRELAAEADRRGVTGAACERAYGSLLGVEFSP